MLLFRYSALTFNSHRIHYDRRYVTEREGYPGLIVHGPLLATLLADVAVDGKPDSTLATFSFRALAPVFDGVPFEACARDAPDGTTELWIATADGTTAVEASASSNRRTAKAAAGRANGIIDVFGKASGNTRRAWAARSCRPMLPITRNWGDAPAGRRA